MPWEAKKGQAIADRLIEFQRAVRDRIISSRTISGLEKIDRSSSADTIYRIDALVEPLIEDLCREWSKSTPLILIAEGIEDEEGREGIKVYPRGTPVERALIQLIIDPIDGTRGLMYDKRSAWALAGVAPNRGAGTRLRDIEVAVMTELPISKMGRGDTLWAIKGRGTRAVRTEFAGGLQQPLLIAPSTADSIDHGFSSVVNFFPGTKLVAGELMERIAEELIPSTEVRESSVFDDQYISTGGQFYELVVGHDRFIADLRPLFYEMQGKPQGLCCHPYDCACWLVAKEAGVILTDGLGGPLDGPMDVTSGISWIGYANAALRGKIEPIVKEFLRKRMPR